MRRFKKSRKIMQNLCDSTESRPLNIKRNFVSATVKRLNSALASKLPLTPKK